MRTVEEITLGSFKVVIWVRHEARTYNEYFDKKLKELLSNVIYSGLKPISNLLPNERFWQFFIHPSDEIKYQFLIKHKINGIHFIE